MFSFSTQCLRLSSKAVRPCQRALSTATRSSSATRTHRIAPAFRSYRPTRPFTTSFNPSSNESTIQGTIGKGASGVKDEKSRLTKALVAPDYLNEKEKMIWEKLSTALEPTELEVQDISGGCGSMYGIDIVSEKFRGLNMLKQQRLVNEVLGEEIKGWHGVQLKTRVP